jgi:hypothetical protein
LNKWLGSKNPGDKSVVIFKHRNVQKTESMIIGESPDIQLQLDANASAEALRKREAWWKSRL